jgi:hypothetical protein
MFQVACPESWLEISGFRRGQMVVKVIDRPRLEQGEKKGFPERELLADSFFSVR